MKDIEAQMSIYAAYHQDARNKATHFIGVPAIILSLYIPLDWIRLQAGDVYVSAAMALTAALLIYYFVLDVPLALAMLIVMSALVWVGHQIAAMGFVPGWIFVAPIFLAAEVFFALGYKPSLHQAVQRRAAEMRRQWGQNNFLVKAGAERG